jgi:hypothetical protein
MSQGFEYKVKVHFDSNVISLIIKYEFIKENHLYTIIPANFVFSQKNLHKYIIKVLGFFFWCYINSRKI